MNKKFYILFIAVFLLSTAIAKGNTYFSYVVDADSIPVFKSLLLMSKKDFVLHKGDVIFSEYATHKGKGAHPLQFVTTDPLKRGFIDVVYTARAIHKKDINNYLYIVDVDNAPVYKNNKKGIPQKIGEFHKNDTIVPDAKYEGALGNSALRTQLTEEHVNVEVNFGNVKGAYVKLANIEPCVYKRKALLPAQMIEDREIQNNKTSIQLKKGDSVYVDARDLNNEKHLRIYSSDQKYLGVVPNPNAIRLDGFTTPVRLVIITMAVIFLWLIIIALSFISYNFITEIIYVCFPWLLLYLFGEKMLWFIDTNYVGIFVMIIGWIVAAAFLTTYILKGVGYIKGVFSGDSGIIGILLGIILGLAIIIWGLKVMGIMLSMHPILALFTFVGLIPAGYGAQPIEADLMNDRGGRIHGRLDGTTFWGDDGHKYEQNHTGAFGKVW